MIHDISMALVPEDGPPDTSAFDPDVEAALRRIADPCSIATGESSGKIAQSLPLPSTHISVGTEPWGKT